MRKRATFKVANCNLEETRMNFNRRLFFSMLLASRLQKSSFRVVVMEAFNQNRSSAALLVHHADQQHRVEFAEWLRTHPQTPIRVRSQTGRESLAMIFRVRMCFGRGLILLQSDLGTREGDILTIEYG